MMRSSLESDVSCVAAPGGQRNKKRFPSRWSLRHFIYSSPILNRRRSQTSSGSSKNTKNNYGRDSVDAGKQQQQGGSSKEIDRGAPHHVEIHQATSRTSVFTASTKSGEVIISMECPLCFFDKTAEEFWDISGCGHRACRSCLRQYLRVEITESRVCISCPICSEMMHPNEIRNILENESLYEKYQDFMVRRVLAIEPDTRWCPAPDCGFAVIASECASCPKLKCLRPGCDSYFCYHCKAEWHPNQTCDAARAQRSPNIRSSSISYSPESQNRDDIKPCPRCQVLIVKMDDGSCNHMMCAVCGAEFCWLCMKEISDLHYLSPSGCTFWGKKPWSRKKKILWQLGTLVGAPVGIALVAGITVPAMIIGIPVWVGRKLYTRYKTANKHKRYAAIIGGVIASVIISPILAGLAVGIGVPILLFYVYGVVPVSLCRSGGCGGSAPNDDPSFVPNQTTTSNADTTSMDAVSAKLANASIGEASLSMASGSHVLLRGVSNGGDTSDDRESASTVAMAGSVDATAMAAANGQKLEVQADLTAGRRCSMSSLTESADDGAASTRALAGSVLNYKTYHSDSCSCATADDSVSVRFDDNSSFLHAEKTSIGSSCSFRARCSNNNNNHNPTKASLSRSERIYDTLSNDDSISIDLANATSSASSSDEKAGAALKSQAALLRSQFFYSTFNDGTGAIVATKSLDDKTVIEVSNEALDKHLATNLPLIRASSFDLESSKL